MSTSRYWVGLLCVFVLLPSQAQERSLPEILCSTCHVFPTPDLLDRNTWTNQTLPRMKIRVGLAPEEIEKHPEAELLKASGIFLTAPLVNETNWQAVVAFYATNAPVQTPPQKEHAPIEIGLAGFTVEVPRFREKAPATTMVQINAKEHRAYFGDAGAGSLAILDDSLKLIQQIPTGNAPVSLYETSTNAWITMIGSFMPTEVPRGALVRAQKIDGQFVQPQSILKELPRTTHAAFGDLNGDGREDFALSIFGSNTGRFSWFEQLANGEYKEHVLWEKAGAVRSEIRDFNGDGRPDIAVLVAQETEGLFIYFNDGNGEFHSRTVFQRHPLFGHTYFESGDFNNDGNIDFLVCNGDNGEYVSPYKNYHGVRIYAGDGNMRWNEAWFYPMHGAFGARARDFDLDGDLDIAAISFFPDYESNPRESFVYLENRGGKGSFDFAPRTFPQCISGRWLTMDAGDLDGDGDEDIVLGSYIHGPSEVPQQVMKMWEARGPSMLLLRNNARSIKPSPPAPKPAETAAP